VNYFAILKIANSGLIEKVCGLLDCKEPKVLYAALKTLENIFTASRECSVLNQNFSEETFTKFHDYGYDKLENLQNHPNPNIYEFVVNILNEFFQVEEDLKENQELITTFVF